MTLKFFAPCAKGLEYLLVDELKALGAGDVHEALMGVYFSGTLETGYRAVLWSRLASRVLLSLLQTEVRDIDALYDAVRSVRWDKHLNVNDALAVDFSGSNEFVRHTNFGALKVKDAICDQFRATQGARPDVDTEAPTVRINAHLHHDNFSLSIDLGGHALHERGYRPRTGIAPIKETLAAAMLVRAQWPKLAAQGAPLVDPMCGAGTLAIEAVLMACDIAPGLFRDDFGFTNGWKGHDAVLWKTLVDDAEVRAEQGCAASKVNVFAFDADSRVLRIAEENAENAGVPDFIRFQRGSVRQLKKPVEGPGLVISNPPYGERIGNIDELKATYAELGQCLHEQFAGWQAALITSEPSLAQAVGLRSHKQYALFNGPLACKLYLFDLNEQNRWIDARNKAPRSSETREPRVELPVAPLSAAAQALHNRIDKNFKHLKRWRDREQVSCYRLYDADLPEYAAAIDVYDGHLFIQEYQAPRDVPEELAAGRLRELVEVAARYFAVDAAQVQLRTRARQKGSAQYEKQDSRRECFVVEEGGLKFEVNLSDYLDTGLFLDHRMTRALVRERSRGKHVLNLFSYTGSFSVYAAAGGAASTTSVDLSKTYCQWALRNLGLNGFERGPHLLVQADVLQWLEEATEKFDLIVCDPPTFSNSKRMDDVFDVQRDHVALLRACLELLMPGGELIFSNNNRRFQLEREAFADCTISDWSRKTLPPDFARDPKIRQCWHLKPRD